MLMISPTGKEVPIGQTLKPDEYIGMTRYVFVFAFLFALKTNTAFMCWCLLPRFLASMFPSVSINLKW